MSNYRHTSTDGNPKSGGRYTSVIPIGLDYIPTIFGVKHKFIGNNGENLVYIAQGTGADIEIVSDRPLKVQISHDDADELIVAKKLVQSLIDEVRSQFRHFPQPEDEEPAPSYDKVGRDIDMRQYDPMYPTPEEPREAMPRSRPPHRDAPDHVSPRRRRSRSPQRRPERGSRWGDQEHTPQPGRMHPQNDYDNQRREPGGQNHHLAERLKQLFYSQSTTHFLQQLQADYDRLVDSVKRVAPDRRQHMNPRPHQRTYCKVCDMQVRDMEGHLRDRQHDEMYLSLQLKLGSSVFMEEYGREVPFYGMDTHNGWDFATSAVSHLYGDSLPADIDQAYLYQRMVVLLGELKNYHCEVCGTMHKHLPNFIKHVTSDEHAKSCRTVITDCERDGRMPPEGIIWPLPKVLDRMMSGGGIQPGILMNRGSAMKRPHGNDMGRGDMGHQERGRNDMGRGDMGRNNWTEPPPVKRAAYSRDFSEGYTCPVATCQMGCRDPEDLARHWLELHTRVTTHYFCPEQGCGSFTSVDLKNHLMKQHSFAFKSREDVNVYLEQNPVINRRVKQARYIDPGMAKMPEAIRELLAPPSTNCLPNDDENWNLVSLAFRQWCSSSARPGRQPMYGQRPAPQPPIRGLLGDSPSSFKFGGGAEIVTQFCPFRGCTWIGKSRESLFEHFKEHKDKFKSPGAALTCIRSIPAPLLLDKSNPDWKSISKYVTPHLLPKPNKKPGLPKAGPRPLLPTSPVVDAQKSTQYCPVPECAWSGVGRPALVTHCKNHSDRFVSDSMMMKCLISIPVSALVKSSLSGAGADMYLKDYLVPAGSKKDTAPAAASASKVSTKDQPPSANAKNVKQFCPVSGCSWEGIGRPELLKHWLSPKHSGTFLSNTAVRKGLHSFAFESLEDKSTADWADINEKLVAFLSPKSKEAQKAPSSPAAKKASLPAPAAKTASQPAPTAKNASQPAPTEKASPINAKTAQQYCPLQGCKWNGKGRPALLGHCQNKHRDIFGSYATAMKCLAEIPVSALTDEATIDKAKLEEKVAPILKSLLPAASPEPKAEHATDSEEKDAAAASSHGKSLFCPWCLCDWTGENKSELKDHCVKSHSDIFKSDMAISKCLSTLTDAALSDRSNANWVNIDRSLRPCLKITAPKPMQEARSAPQFCPVRSCSWCGIGRPALIKHCEVHKEYFETPSQVMKCLLSIPVNMLISRPTVDWDALGNKLGAAGPAKSSQGSKSPKSDVSTAHQYCPFRSCSWTGKGRPNLLDHCSVRHLADFTSLQELKKALNKITVPMLQSKPDMGKIEELLAPHLVPAKRKTATNKAGSSIKTNSSTADKTGTPAEKNSTSDEPTQFCPIRSCGWVGKGRLELLAHCNVHKDDITAVNFMKTIIEKMPVSLLKNREFADWMEINKEIKKCMKRTKLAKLKKDPAEFNSATAPQFCPLRTCPWVGKGRPAVLKHCTTEHEDYFESPNEIRKCLSAIPVSAIADKSKVDWDALQVYLTPYKKKIIAKPTTPKKTQSSAAKEKAAAAEHGSMAAANGSAASPIEIDDTEEEPEKKKRDALALEALKSSRENCKQQ